MYVCFFYFYFKPDSYILVLNYEHITCFWRNCWFYTCPKNPCNPNIDKSILSLKPSISVGKVMGKRRVREHVDTVGSTKSVENRMHGSTSPNPKGGTQVTSSEKKHYIFQCCYSKTHT